MSYNATLFNQTGSRITAFDIDKPERIIWHGGRYWQIDMRFDEVRALIYREVVMHPWQEPEPLPLVSCILVTKKDRLWCLPDALRSWAEQTYPNRELIVVSEDPEVADALPKHPAIAFRDCKVGATVGHKRNLAIDWAHGDIIAHFDSDDYSHPERLAEQVKALKRYPAQVCGYHTLRFLHTSGMTREFTLKEPHELHGNSLAYYRDHWERVGKFPDRNWAEDGHLLARTDPKLIARLDGGERTIARHEDYKYNPEWRVVEPARLPKPPAVLFGMLSWNRADVITESAAVLDSECSNFRLFGYECRYAIVDNGSQDNTVSQLHAIGLRNGYIDEMYKNLGSAAGRNYLATEWVTGCDYIMLVDCDISIVPGSALAMLQALRAKQTTAACVGADWRNGTEDPAQTTDFCHRIDRLTHSPGLALTQYGMFQAGLLREYKFDENFGPGWGGEDNDWAMQVEACTGLQCWMADEIRYLHRGAHGSLKHLAAGGLDVRQDAKLRYEYLIRKWKGHEKFTDIVRFFEDKVKTGDVLPMEVTV